MKDGSAARQGVRWDGLKKIRGGVSQSFSNYFSKTPILCDGSRAENYDKGK